MSNDDHNPDQSSDEDRFAARIAAALETIVVPSRRDVSSFVKKRGAELRRLHDAGMQWEEIARFVAGEIGNEVRPGTVSQYMAQHFPNRNRAWQAKTAPGDAKPPALPADVRTEPKRDNEPPRRATRDQKPPAPSSPTPSTPSDSPIAGQTPQSAPPWNSLPDRPE